MRKGWIMNVRNGLEKQAFDEYLETYDHLTRNHPYKGTWLAPWEMLCREAPGQVKRQRRKEAGREKDRTNVSNIIAKIFYKKKLRLPPNTVSGLGWIRKPNEY